jgi:hypothetical protein
MHIQPPGFSVANVIDRQPPAQAAQAAIAAQSDLADQPFGKLVSDFARGIPLPSSATSASTTTT